MLKLKAGCAAARVAGENILIPSGEELNLDEMIVLNDTGYFLVQRMQTGATEEELTEALLKEYAVDPERARQSVEAFARKLRAHHLLEES